MNNDKLVVCPRCEGNACYGNEVTEEITTWHCFGCGFCTNSLMKEGEEFFDKQRTVLRELYKYLLFVDGNGLTWNPTDKGYLMVWDVINEGWRMVNFQTIQKIRFGRQDYHFTNFNHFLNFMLVMGKLQKIEKIEDTNLSSQEFQTYFSVTD